MWLLDDWHDWFRLLNLIICGICVFLLARRFNQSNSHWNTKTKDYWFALNMWCVAGMALSIEGMLRDSDSGARLVFILTASAVSLKGLLHKGTWGGRD